jgi:leucyl/phenylalanyl-tRNA---protein transferase
MLTWLQRDTLTFPPLANAMREPNGLLAAGGDLSADRLVQAYRHGCFRGSPKASPSCGGRQTRARCCFPPSCMCPAVWAKLLRQQRYEVTFDRDFAAVIQACAAPRSYADGTWITDDMQNAYLELHQRGYAHSVEVWDHGELVGGLYGLAMGQLFFGESMFSRADNASKVALPRWSGSLQAWGFVLIDCQMPTDHLQSLGARAIPRSDFADYLHDHLDQASKVGRGFLRRHFAHLAYT